MPAVRAQRLCSARVLGNRGATIGGLGAPHGRPSTSRSGTHLQSQVLVPPGRPPSGTDEAADPITSTLPVMAGVTFEDLVQRLTPEALKLLEDMAGAHLESTGDRMFLRADSAAGTHMIFTGDGSRRQFNDFDGGAVEDLISWCFLHLSYGGRRGTPNYRLSGEALRFYRWLMQRQGSAVAQVEEEVRRVAEGSGFAEAHPGGAHHLREAFELLWAGRTDEQVVSEIGDHLRKALMDVTTDVVGPDNLGGQEKPIQRLKSRLEELHVPRREADVLVHIVELARVVLRLDHRLNHIRDEADQGEPGASWEEIRRATFTTALVCYELDRLRSQG